MSRRRSGISLPGSVIVLTGATSGIGRAMAVELAGRGATVVLAARNADELAAVAAECRRRGGDALDVPTDVSDPDAVSSLIHTAHNRFGRLDALVNNAGVMAYGRYDEVPAETHRQVILTNLLGAMHATSVILPILRDQRHGVVVNVASLYGEMTTPFVSSYVASKFGLLGFSRVLRRDAAGIPGVEVCCVLPSSVDTPIFRHAANYTRRPVVAIPPAIDVQRVVRVVLGVLERPRKEVRIGWFGRFFAFGQKTMPWLYDALARRATERLLFAEGDSPVSDGNVFAPVGWWNVADGGWRNPRRRLWSSIVGGVAIGAGLALLGARAGR